MPKHHPGVPVRTSSGCLLSGRLKGVLFGTMALVLNGRITMGGVRTLETVYAIRTIALPSVDIVLFLRSSLLLAKHP